jgi:hypothetical protein
MRSFSRAFPFLLLILAVPARLPVGAQRAAAGTVYRTLRQGAK